MWSVPLRVSCPGPVLRLACLGGGRSGPGSPLLGLGLRGRRLGVPGGVPSSIAWGCRGLRCGRAVVGAPLCSRGGGERRRLGVQAPARRILLTCLMRTELRPAGCVGGLGRPWLEWCSNVPVHGPAGQPYRGLTLSTGGGGCGRVCSVTRLPVYLWRQPPRRQRARRAPHRSWFEPRDRWSPTDPFEYRARPPTDLFEYR